MFSDPIKSPEKSNIDYGTTMVGGTDIKTRPDIYKIMPPGARSVRYM